MRMDLRNDIRVIGGFQKAVNALYFMISALRVLAVAFLVLPTVLLLFSEKTKLIK